MRKIVIVNAFELGFEARPNCPSNIQMQNEGKPMYA